MMIRHCFSPPTIDTARLRLRARTFDDLEPIIEMDADPLVRRFIGGPLDQATHRAEVRWRIVEGRPEPHASWAIEWRDHRGLIGLCHLSPSEETGLTQIGWRLHTSAWGQGVATEAARAVLARALGPIELPVIVALIHPANHASIRVAEKIGMTPAGVVPYRGVLQTLYRVERAHEPAPRPRCPSVGLGEPVTPAGLHDHRQAL
jgi:RimJ/RimL family protein N-acetyltransferase